MDSTIQLIDTQVFQSYAMRVAQNMALKQQQITAWGGEWFDQLRAYEEGSEFDRKGSVAVIKVRGYLGFGYDFWMWLMDGSSYCGIMNKVRAAAGDSGVTKIVLDVNSPGGGTIGVIEASNAIFAAREKKEVVAVINPAAASAGYWLASQATRIVALESGFIGSVGAEVDYRSFHRYMTEAGIDYSIIRSKVSPDKNIDHELEPINDRAKEYLQGLCDYAGDLFISHVARGRMIKESEVISDFGKGLMFFGTQAIERNMVDAIGDLATELSVPATSSGRSKSKVYGSSMRPTQESKALTGNQFAL